MRRRVQISFLSAFLTLLTVAFAAALAVRVHSYSGKTMTDGTSATAGPASGPGADGTVDRHRSDPSLPADGTSGSSAGSAAAAATPAARTASAASSARAQRLRELLALGAPAGPVKTVAPPIAPVKAPAPQAPVKPAIAKTIQPVANPFNGARSSSSAAPQPGSSSSKPNTTTTGPVDPNSDTTPPQLISISFDPPQVQGGGDTTLIVTATDDLSGIRGISGTLTSPSGKAVQGFAQQKDGDTMRYLSRIHMPDTAEEGIWKVSFLTMSDMATNSVTLSYAQGSLPPTAVLKVISSASDSTPPTLSNVWLDRRAMRAGEHNTLFVDAQDDKSGVHLVAAVFLSPSKLARIGVGCQKGTDVWQCDIFPPLCLDCGDWTLEQVQLQDNANNFATVRSENPAVAAIRLNITADSCDNTPPVLQGVSMNRTEVVMGRDEPVVEVTAQVSDDACGIGGVSAQVVGPGTSSSGMFFSFQQRDGNTFVGTIRLDPHAARGVWHLASLTVSDKGQNLKIYYANDPLLSRAMFTVK
ncbi:MAG TPA: hypothetical protein VLC46_05925 [Thermoanaerobaculia bacterium]|nr:hypothetical protein [Thermoanaerobaculia bacterium]